MVHSSRTISPASGVSVFKISENSVDLPAPFGPTRATRSPWLIVIARAAEERAGR